MSSISDVNRVQPGQVYDNENVLGFKDICERVVHLEQILAQKTMQWNAPSLLRGSINNFLPGSGVTHTDDLYIQGGVEVMPFSEWDGVKIAHVLTLPAVYDVKPLFLYSLNSSSLNVGINYLWGFATSQSLCSLWVFPAGAPTSGAVYFQWLTIGKKVE